MKKVFIIKSLFFFIILITAVSCQKDYKKTLDNYLKYLKKSDYKNAYELLSSKDKDVVSYKNYSKEDGESAISKNISKRIIYKIKDSSLSETGGIAKINVLVNKIDLKKAFYFIPKLLNENLSENEIDRIFKNNNKILKGCYSSSDIEYKLILEDGCWRIDAGFGRKRSIRMLLDDAEDYFKNNNYKSALEKYESVLDFDNYNNEALNNIMQIREKENYIQKFLEINYKILENNEKGAKIKLNITNNGTIVVRKIFVDFVFYNNAKEIVFESRKEILGNLSKNLGFKKDVASIISFENVIKPYSIECNISAIDF